MKKYLFRTSSTGYTLLTVDDNEDIDVSTFRDDQGLPALTLIMQAREASDPTYWQTQIADALPLKSAPLFASK